MSIKSPVKNTSIVPKMSEHLTDSNILCSRKTYGKKKDYKNISISNENGSSSASVSELLKNNGTSLLSNYSEELYSEKNFESVTSNYTENSNIQKGSIVNSEISLFNDDDTDYYFSVSTDFLKNHNSSLSIPEASSSGSNYQRTRKNLKNQLSNQRFSSEELSESTSQEENSNSVNDSKFAKKVLNLKQASPTEQNSSVCIDNQVEHTKNNVIVDTCINKLPENPIIFHMTNQAEKITSKGTMFKNSSNAFPVLEMVNKWSKSGQAPEKSNRNKRKRIPGESETVSAKKTSVVKRTISSKVNSVEKKVSNSAMSIKNYTKSTILNSDIISTVGYQGALKKSDFKTPSKAPKHLHSPKKGNNECVDTMKEKSALALGNGFNNLSVQKKGVKTPSKAIQKGKNGSLDSTKKSIQMLQTFVSKNKAVKNYATTKVKCIPSHNLAAPVLSLVKSETVEKIHPGNGDKQIEKTFVYELDAKMQSDNDKQIEKPPSVLETAEKIQLGNGDKQIQKPCLLMPLMHVPVTAKGIQVPSAIWGNLSITDNSIQIDRMNFKDLSIPGPSTLNNVDSSMKTSDYCVKNLHAEETTTTTTTTTIINQTDIGYDRQKRFFRPRTHINDGIEFHQFMDNSLKNIENSCSLKLKEESSKFFQMNPSLLNITVKEFLDTPTLTDVLLDYVNGLEMSKPLEVPSLNKGYDFPENFEDENLLRLVKDFVHTAISYMIPANAPKPIHISYSRIINAAMFNMSSRELIVIMRVFKKTDTLFKLKDVCARLSLVALFVIFDEYQNKIRRSR